MKNSGKAERQELRRQHQELRRKYKDLYDTVSEILYQHDPIGINFVFNIDEYEPEVGTILPRLKEANSPIELRKIVHEEFVRWFSSDLAGDEGDFTEITEEIWDAYQMKKGMFLSEQ